jgi:nucleoid DNA-binding protein
MFQKETQKIIKSMSLDYYIEEKRVEEVVKSQFQFVRDQLVNVDRNDVKSYKTIKLLKFGKFIPNTRMLYYILKAKNKKDENNPEESI